MLDLKGPLKEMVHGREAGKSDLSRMGALRNGGRGGELSSPLKKFPELRSPRRWEI